MKDIITDLTDLKYLKWDKTRHSSGTAGSFLKSYDETGNIKKYYKLSDYVPGTGVVGHECINEIIVQRLLSILGIEHLEYRLIHALINIDDTEIETYLCESDDYKSRDESKIAFEDFYTSSKNTGETLLDMCKRLGWETHIYNMLITDYLILNRDRHGANIEILRNRKNNTCRLAPLFDHGVSLMCRCHSDEEFASYDVMEDKRVQAFIGTANTTDNLSLIPTSYIKEFIKSHPFKDTDKSFIFEGLDDIVSKVFLQKAWEMISRRYDHLGNI